MYTRVVTRFSLNLTTYKADVFYKYDGKTRLLNYKYIRFETFAGSTKYFRLPQYIYIMLSYWEARPKKRKEDALAPRASSLISHADLL